MRFLEMDQSAKQGEKWRRRAWRQHSWLHITPTGKAGDGWTVFVGKESSKKVFEDHEFNATDWERV